MSSKKNSNRKKNLFIRFWRSENSKVSLVRDILIAFLIVIVILIGLWTYTGQWFGAPMVAIESGSMMHKNEPYGRLGTIDAGDMVLLVKVYDRDDVVTWVAHYENNYHYGNYGDVIIYKPDGESNTEQIIHRAMCWVDVEDHGSYKLYTFEGYDEVYNSSQELFIPSLGIRNRSNRSIKVDWWTNSGFITKGDNTTSNYQCDQVGGISRQPVKIEWISGKARFELPWIGTINLLFNDLIGGKNTLGNVPKDSIACLVILLETLVLIPVSLDIYGHYRNKKKQLYLPKYITQTSISPKDFKNRINSLGIIGIYYWTAMIIFVILYVFFLTGIISQVLHILIMILVHIMFFFLVYIEGKLMKAKDLKMWSIITAFTGPIGATIFYFYKLNEYNKLTAKE
jgi:signal peptidase